MMKAISRHKIVTWFKVFQDHCLCVFLVNVDLICKSCKQVPILVLARTVISPKNKIIDVSIATIETYVRTGNIGSISSFDTLMSEGTSWFSFLSHFRPSNRCKSFVENYDSFARKQLLSVPVFWVTLLLFAYQQKQQSHYHSISALPLLYTLILLL